MRTDAGELKVEFFSKVFEVARGKMFGNIDDINLYAVAKRSEGSQQIFKIFGIIIALDFSSKACISI